MVLKSIGYARLGVLDFLPDFWTIKSMLRQEFLCSFCWGGFILINRDTVLHQGSNNCVNACSGWKCERRLYKLGLQLSKHSHWALIWIAHQIVACSLNCNIYSGWKLVLGMPKKNRPINNHRQWETCPFCQLVTWAMTQTLGPHCLQSM